jgi:hypothetical protein
MTPYPDTQLTYNPVMNLADIVKCFAMSLPYEIGNSEQRTGVIWT